MASRIGLRMQLMREQAQQEEQRERMQQQAVMHYMQQQQQQQQQLGGPPTPAINTPVHFQSPPPVKLNRALSCGIDDYFNSFHNFNMCVKFRRPKKQTFRGLKVTF